MKTVLVVLIHKRRSAAVKVQRILTEFGCIIKTRLGIHDGVIDKCSDTGLLILELAGENKQKKELSGKLNKLSGVKTKLVNLSF